MKVNSSFLALLFLFALSVFSANGNISESPASAPGSSHGQVATMTETIKSWGDMVLEVFQDPLKHVTSLWYMFTDVQDLLTRFETLYTEISAMIQDISTWIYDYFFKTKQQLAAEAKERLEAVNDDVKLLVKLRQKIEYRCLHPRDAETRSLCIEHNMELDHKLQTARRQQAKFRQEYDTYKEYL